MGDPSEGRSAGWAARLTALPAYRIVSGLHRGILAETEPHFLHCRLGSDFVVSLRASLGVEPVKLGY